MESNANASANASANANASVKKSTGSSKKTKKKGSSSSSSASKKTAEIDSSKTKTTTTTTTTTTAAAAMVTQEREEEAVAEGEAEAEGEAPAERVALPPPEVLYSPLDLITLDPRQPDPEQAQFVVNEKAVAALASIQGPVAVVAIAGLYRTGKSFVMNQLAGAQDGFDIGASVEPCTHGIWMWIVDPAHVPDSVPTNVTIVLIDTEGLGSFAKSATYDVKIFSLAVLLSSYFVYNSLGTIDDNAMDKLSLVVELTRSIRAQAEQGADSSGHLSLYFPRFMWLVRDFSLELVISGQRVSSDEYLERALLPVPPVDERAVGKNEIRECIRQAFHDRSCFTMVRPVNDEELLQELARAKKEDFRPEYLEQIAQLVDKIYSGLRPKKMYSQVFNGAMLAELTKAYVAAINEGGVPTISSAWESVTRIECSKALESACSHYDKKMKQRVEKDVMDTSELLQLHESCKEDAAGRFRAQAVGDNTHEYLDKLAKHIADSFKSFEHRNNEASTQLCQGMLKAHHDEVNKLLQSNNITSMEALEVLWKKFMDKYQLEAKGPAKYKEFFSHLPRLLDSSRQVSQIETNLARQQLQKQMEEEKEKAKAEYDRLEKLYASVDAEWKKADDDNRKLKVDNKSMAAEIADLKKSLEASARQLREAEESVARLKETEKGLQSELEKERESVKNLERRVAESERPNPMGIEEPATATKRSRSTKCCIIQ